MKRARDAISMFNDRERSRADNGGRMQLAVRSVYPVAISAGVLTMYGLLSAP